MSQIVSVEYLQTYCRTCLEELHECKYEIERLPKEIFQILKQITGYKMAQRSLYPKWICETCNEQIKSFNEFKVMIKENTKYLDDLVEQNQVDFKSSYEGEEETIFLQAEDPQCVLNEDVTKVKTSDCEGFENVFMPSEVKIEDDNFENSNLENIQLADSLSLTNPQVAEIKVEPNSEQDAATVRETGHKDTSCKICGLTYSTVELLKLHMRSHKEMRSFRCELCGNGFNKKSNLNLHIKEVHAQTPLKIDCKFKCGKTFSRSQSAKAHYRAKHNLELEAVSDNDLPTQTMESKIQFDDSDESSVENFDLLFISKTTCKICHKTYSSPAALRLHMNLHKEKRPFQCEKCERGFNKKQRLNEHIQEMHAEKVLEIVCKYGCGKSFLRFQTAASHYRNKHAQEVNSKTANESDNLEKEERKGQADTDSKNTTHDVKIETDSSYQEHHQNEPAMHKLTCKICLQTYSSPSTLRVHMRLHREKRPFQCQQCERSFNKNARLKRHVAEDHTTIPIEIACKFGCGKIFRRQETATNHYYLKHTLPEKGIKPKENSFVCEDCGRLFKNLFSLKEHSFTHRPVEDRPYKCEQCGKAFVSKRYYEDHLLRHAGVKNFECSHCGVKKTTQRDLRLHINNHHTENKKTHSCMICEKVFNRLENLRLHERVVHQGIKRYKCSYCDQAFGKPDTLKHHVMRHTGERPHKCQVCDRSFIQAVALRTHMKTHTK